VIVVAQGYGRFCNRMTFFSHLVALSLEHDFQLVNPMFAPYRHLFPGLDSRQLASDSMRLRIGSEWSLVPLALKAWERWGAKDIAIGPVEVRFSGDGRGGPIVDRGFIQSARSRLVVLATGWNVTAFEAVERHAAKIRRTFTPHPTVLSRVERWLGDRTLGGSRWVGLHVRRKDYREWESGRFFWSDEEYLELIRRLLDLGDFKFALVTDEPDALGPVLLRHPAVEVSDLSDIEDLILLSRSDLIVGPPSTFSTWASFFGNTPILHPQHPAQRFCLDDFRVVAPQFVQFGGPLRSLT
jgi:hypothetical protein